jgi:lipid-binding SYLF domain-containing protein
MANRSLAKLGIGAGILSVAALALAACQSAPTASGGDSLEQQRTAIREHERRTLERLYAEYPDSRKEVESAAGHAVFDLSAVNAVLFVGQKGRGVLVNHENKAATFMTAYRAGTGPGLGYQQLSQVFIFKSAAAVSQFSVGETAGGDVSAGATIGTSNVQQSFNPEITVYQLNDKGFAVQANWGGTAYVADAELNKP